MNSRAANMSSMTNQLLQADQPQMQAVLFRPVLGKAPGQKLAEMVVIGARPARTPGPVRALGSGSRTRACGAPSATGQGVLGESYGDLKEDSHTVLSKTRSFGEVEGSVLFFSDVILSKLSCLKTPIHACVSACKHCL